MWPYEDHDENEYKRVLRFVEEYAVSLGAKPVDIKGETFRTLVGDKYIKESPEMNVYQFGEEYFWIEHHFTSSCPFIVFSFGDSIETVGSDDAEPFPYDLEEDELKAEVRYSLGVEEYPKE